MATDYDALFEQVSGDVEVVGAIAALSPALGAALGASRRRIDGAGSEGRGLDTHLPCSGGNAAVAAGGSVSLTATPLRNFKPRRFVIHSEAASVVTVSSATIAGIPQLAGAGDMPATAFSPLAQGMALDWQVIPQNQSLIVVATNRHASAAAAIYGSVYGQYTLGM